MPIIRHVKNKKIRPIWIKSLKYHLVFDEVKFFIEKFVWFLSISYQRKINPGFQLFFDVIGIIFHIVSETIVVRKYYKTLDASDGMKQKELILVGFFQ